MKRILLTGAFLMALSFTANAQSTSFEQIEGYTQGNIHGQQGWTTTGVTNEDQSTGNIEGQLVSSLSASDGFWSLQLNKEEAFAGQSETIAGAFKDFETTGDYTVSYDILIGQQSQNDSDFSSALFAGEQGSLAAQVQFAYTGEFVVRYPGTNQQTGQPALLAYLFESEPTWEPEVWYNVTMAYTVEDDMFTFYLDGVELGTIPSISNAELMSTIAFRHDNYGGFAYVDNIVMDGATSNVQQNKVETVSVYPNPTNGIVNIANNNSVINSVAVVDINGRTVKSAKFDAVSSAQVNISDLANGVYMMTINSDKGTVTKKVVKN
jgi:hypothetical protein